MDIRRAKEEILHTVKAYLAKDAKGNYEIPLLSQRPILLIGPPGIGKTAVVSQVAEELGVNLVSYSITHHTRQSAIGLPFIEHRTYGGEEVAVTEYTMSEIIASLYDTSERTGIREGILFLDEINCVSETLAPALLQFLQEKIFGTHKMPEGWILVTAGNPPAYNKSVREFDIVTLDRMRKLSVEADYGVWRGYAVQRGVHPAVLAYLDLRPEQFYRVETGVEGKNFVTARGWEDLSLMIRASEKLGLPVDEVVIGSYLQHVETAKDFAAYYELWLRYEAEYRVEDILAGTVPPTVYAKAQAAPFDERTSIVLMVTDKLCRQFAAVNEADPTDETAPNGTAVEAQLEHAFDFVEAAYGRDQELILFLTELSMRREAQTFLMAYPCERYYDYAAKYLSSDARTELQEDILANL